MEHTEFEARLNAFAELDLPDEVMRVIQEKLETMSNLTANERLTLDALNLILWGG